MSTIFAVVIGYCIAVIFPMPVISRAILDGWGRIGTALKSKT